MQGVVSVFTSILCVGVLLSSCEQEDLKPLDHSTVNLAQFEEIEQTEKVAVVKTSEGDIKIRFFENEAPQLSKSFEDLLEQGYFTNSEMRLSQGGFGDGGKLTVHPSRKIISVFKKNMDDPSVNLLHIPGAISAVVDKNGKPTGEFYILTKRDVQTEEIQKMNSCSYPQDIVDAFEEYGGYPDLWLKAPLFAQVYEGLDVVEKIKEGSLEGESFSIESVVIKLYDGQ